MNQVVKVPSVLMRGGTSKGLIINVDDLPHDQETRDDVITRIFGSPDKRQIDGIGGGTPLTSKLALVGRTSEIDIDIIYTFGQVNIDNKDIDYTPTCGNMSAAVGLFAAEEGYCKLTEPITTVRIFNTNTNKIIEVEIPVKNKEIQYEGQYSIDGVYGTAPCINVNFLDSGGAITGKLLPTGNVRDEITIHDGRIFHVSIIDSANIVVFVDAQQIKMSGTEIGEQFNQPEILDLLEQIRIGAGVKIGLIKDASIVTPSSHALPKIVVLSKPQSYTTSTEKVIYEDEIDIVGRYVSMGQLHSAFAVSGAIAVATAAQIPGTIVSEIINQFPDNILTIGHPSGSLDVEVEVESESINNQLIVKRAAIGRTARRIMEGHTLVPASVYFGWRDSSFTKSLSNKR